MKRTVSCLLVTLLLAGTGYAQTLTGSVIVMLEGSTINAPK